MGFAQERFDAGTAGPFSGAPAITTITANHHLSEFGSWEPRIGWEENNVLWDQYRSAG